jgi:hypothetical protein
MLLNKKKSAEEREGLCVGPKSSTIAAPSASVFVLLYQ